MQKVRIRDFNSVQLKASGVLIPSSLAPIVLYISCLESVEEH
jgi:hypothetical protein